MASINNSLFSFLVTSIANNIGDTGATSSSDSEASEVVAQLEEGKKKNRKHTNGIHQQFTHLQTLCGEWH